MKLLRTSGLVITLALGAAACSTAGDDFDEMVGGAFGDGSVVSPGAQAGGPGQTSTGGAGAAGGAGGAGGAVRDAGLAGGGSGDRDAAPAGGTPGGGFDAGSPPDGGSTSRDASMSDAAVGTDAGGQGGATDASSTEGGSSSEGGCELPTTFKWTGGGPLAQPKNGWVSMKDFTHVFHNGQHIVYFTTFQSNWGSGMMTFKDWPDAQNAPQTATGFGVAPTLFFFTPKNVWVLAYQWGPHKFSYRTSSDPTQPNGWSAEKSLYNTALPAGGTGPIDQTVICDSAKCYLYYAGDNGHIYKSSLPIANFPGEFPAAQDSGIVGTTQNLFEGVQVYKLKGLNKYLMIVEAQGSGRYFRAFTATTLDGPWTLLTNDFAVKKNATLNPNWTNDISHGDLVRNNPDETFTVDPCNLQLVYQGRDPNINTEYGKLPYRLGLLTLQR